MLNILETFTLNQGGEVMGWKYILLYILAWVVYIAICVRVVKRFNNIKVEWVLPIVLTLGFGFVALVLLPEILFGSGPK